MSELYFLSVSLAVIGVSLLVAVGLLMVLLTIGTARIGTPGTEDLLQAGGKPRWLS